MPFSGGTFTLATGNPVTAGNTIEASWANTTLSDIATGLSTAILKDGTQTLTANIPMGGFKLTGLAAGSSANDSVRMAQLQGNSASYLTGTAGTNTITANGSPTVTGLTTGQRFSFIPANTNTGATTLQIDSTSALNVYWNNAAMVGGELRQNVPVTVLYDGTQYQLIASGAMANTYAIPDDAFHLQAAGDRTKQMIVSLTGISTATTRTVTMPDSNVTLPIINLNATQSANLVLAGPASGSAAVPAFRALTATDGAVVKLISVNTLSNSATSDFASGVTGYDAYAIELVNVVPVSGSSTLTMLMSISGGSTYINAAASYAFFIYASGTDGGSYGTNSASATQIQLTPDTSNRVSSTSASGGVNGWVYANLASASQTKQIQWNLSYAGTIVYGNSVGLGVGQSAALQGANVNGLRFAFDTNNIASGTMRLFGIRNS